MRDDEWDNYTQCEYTHTPGGGFEGDARSRQGMKPHTPDPITTRPRPARDRSTNTEGIAMDVFDQIESEVTGTAVATGMVGGGTGAVAGVLRGLKATGVGFLEVIQWLPVVLKLVAEIGPEIAKIIAMIREAIDGGKTPQAFLGS